MHGENIIDAAGYRAGVAMIIINSKKQVLWAKRIGQDAWQFPQGGMCQGETPLQAMYRELNEELGLHKQDVKIITETKRWLKYKLPEHLIRHYSKPICYGQKQRWYLLKLRGKDARVSFDASDSPEFDRWVWADYWHPLTEVIDFKRDVYEHALKAFAPYIFK